MKKQANPSVKLRSISIENYKGIDSLTLNFPAPQLPHEPDILIMGSENGLGKTSVLECSALLLACLCIRKNRKTLKVQHISQNAVDLLIQAGSDTTKISGNIMINDDVLNLTIQLSRNGVLTITSEEKSILEKYEYHFHHPHVDGNNPNFYMDDLLARICGFFPEPVIHNPFILFHSYRKVQEGNVGLDMLVNAQQSSISGVSKTPLSEFKHRILRSLMNQAGLFEFSSEDDPEKIINTLNILAEDYAGGTISNKLKASADNTVEIQIDPVDGSASYGLDGLSSGQKEMISTLFLMWEQTKDNPSVVFIDEPELHLNAQWHRSVINTLFRLAPRNQYICATHSEDIMASVSKEHRILLLNDKGNGNV
ncbi:MAG: AAA family ATPase [Salinispira sp.]